MFFALQSHHCALKYESTIVLDVVHVLHLQVRVWNNVVYKWHTNWQCMARIVRLSMPDTAPIAVGGEKQLSL